MCGIVGMVGQNDYGFNLTHRKIFENLLWANTLRGNDSVGVFGVNKQGNVDWMKTTGNTASLLSEKDYKDFHDAIYNRYQMVVGHNRAATRGVVSDENAHPFVEGNTILVHNGTLTNHRTLTTQDVEVDSHAILHSIVERGYEETLKEIEGAFTLVWYDTDEKILRMVRNDQRPLYIASCVGAWYFASEGRMLQWIIERENEKISELKEAKPGTLYSFKHSDKKNMWYQPIELYKPKSIVHYILGGKEEKEKKGGHGEGPSSKSNGTSDDKKHGFTYSQDAFEIGDEVTMVVSHIQTLANKTPDGHTHLYSGSWFSDPSVQIRCWATAEEETFIERDSTDGDSEEDPLLVTGKIHAVGWKRNRVQLYLRSPRFYIPIFDMNNTEILPDEFNMTDKKCSYCSEELSVEDLEKGIFVFSDPTDYVIQCPTCYDKEGAMHHAC